MQGVFKFVESSPAAAGGVTASSQVVLGACLGNPSTPGVAGPLDSYQGLFVEANLTNPTGGTLDVFIQVLMDDVWVDYAHFTQLASGTGPFLYAFAAGLNNSTAASLAPFTIGEGLVPALANSTVVGGAWGDRMRLVMKPGAGSVAGASNVIVRISGIRLDTWR
jgi:hypothetical protein